jgi:hypothetical protein
MNLSENERIEIGMRAAESPMVRQDKIWARYSGDKVDVGHGLADAIRMIVRNADADAPLRALSLGSSSEPQFRILESMFRAGLWLVDIEPEAIEIIRERNTRQGIDHVHPVEADYLKLFGGDDAARRFGREHLGGRGVDLVTLHHSMYYAPRRAWRDLVSALYGNILGPGGTIHAVLMSSRADDPASANWLYNHFAGRFFGVSNDQDLPDFARELRDLPRFAGADIRVRSSPARFWCEDFGQLMHGVWMILLHPNVHHFNEAQQREVIEHVYDKVYLPRRPLAQVQDHLFISAKAGQRSQRAKSLCAAAA